MGSLYLIDAHNTDLAASQINGTVTSPMGYTTDVPIRGSFVVNVPFDVPLDGVPQNLGDLITKKFAGILALYPGFQTILFDEQTDASGWLPTPTIPGGVARGSLGSRQTNSAFLGGTLESSQTTLDYSPQTCVLRWEAFEYVLEEATSDVSRRYYREADPDGFVVRVSFNGGATWNSVQPGLIFTIPLADQGSSFRIAFQRTGSTQRLYLGSWALIY